MRIRILALTIAAVLASAGAAAAQVTNGTAVNAPEAPGQEGSANQTLVGPSEAGSRHYRYLMKVETLREKVVETQAKDGGKLTPEHEASLKRELDKLNRTYGVKPG
jgi:hypothetical protein